MYDTKMIIVVVDIYIVWICASDYTLRATIQHSCGAVTQGKSIV